MNHAKTLADLLTIADRAVRVHEAEVARKAARLDLNAAYNRWKQDEGAGHVHRDSEDWALMMAATKAEYGALEQAKRRERNARKRLSDAVIRSGRAKPMAFDDVDLEAA